jgi:N-acetylmuramoyl-L-alanine amidase
MRRSPDTPSTSETALRRSAGFRSHGMLRIAGLVLAAVAFVALGFVLGRVVGSAASGRMRFERNAAVRVQAPGSDTAALAATSSVGAGMIEVPELRGMRADEALVILDTAGFAVQLAEVGTAVSLAESRTVLAQDPVPGTVASADSTVTLTVPPLAAHPSSGAVLPAGSRKTKFVVCIDPGHQAHTDAKLEPVGPGSKTEKPRATGGATGVATGVPEYEIALQLSVNLKRRLEAAGVKVVMTRTTNDVTLPNSARAKIANDAHADLFVRIHGGVSTNQLDSGVSTVYPAANRWTRGIVTPSRSAAKVIERSVCQATSATDRGAKTEAGLAGFNWSAVPSVLVEAGYLSNPVEDKLLASPSYQDRFAQGVCDGVMAYLGGIAR